MNRQKLGRQIAQRVLTGNEPHASTIVVSLQKRPYTVVRIAFDWEGTRFYAEGFSKVNWPDTWDEQYGLEMAVKKAAHDIARQICEKG